MRTIEFLSPTSLKLWETNRLEFYRTYLADVRSERIPQTQPMSVGSAFDANVKSRLVRDIFGVADGRYDFETLFEAQVEPHNRDWAREAGRICMERYVGLGCFSELVQEINQSPVAPRFEFTLASPEAMKLEYGAPLLGKPDLAFESKCGASVVLDWKVNGYCSAKAPSPKPGYKSCRGGSRDSGLPHKNYFPKSYGGIVFNGFMTLDQVDADWATQLCIYGWMLGTGPTARCLAAIDQLCGPEVRVASHRAEISVEWQERVQARLRRAWDRITSGWIFEDMTEEQSREYQAILDRGLSSETPEDRWLNSLRSR